MLSNKLIRPSASSLKALSYSYRNYKNFGHKRQPVAGVTVLWHGFLTFTLIGLGIEWKKVAGFMLGDEELKISIDPTDPVQKD